MDTINSLWIGDRLSTMERLSMKSFVANGHPYNLYRYEPIDGVPSGVTIRDANEVLPYDTLSKFNWTAQFADLFRYTVVFNNGGWWADTDLVCLRPFVFEQETVAMEGANSPFKAPKNSPWLGRVIELANTKSWKTMDWGGIGGALMMQAGEEQGITYVGCHTFDPLQDSSDYQNFVNATPLELSPETYSVHLYHAMWTLRLGGGEGLDPDNIYPATSTYEMLKSRYL